MKFFFRGVGRKGHDQHVTVKEWRNARAQAQSQAEVLRMGKTEKVP